MQNRNKKRHSLQNSQCGDDNALAQENSCDLGAQDLLLNDDDAERQARQQQSVLEKLGESNAHISILKGLTGSQIADHYSSCIKLSSENKISVKNAFALHLIDCMTEMIKKTDSDMSNFQVASCTLDAGQKIYACRVDIIHDEVTKMLGGLGRSSDVKKRDEEEAGRDVDGNEDAHVDKKRKKVKRGNNIETNVKTLNASNLDTNVDIDPLFQRMSQVFSEGTLHGSLLSSLSCIDDGCQFLIDGSASAFAPKNALPAEACRKIDVSNLLCHFNLMKFQSALVCPAFSDFKFHICQSESPDKDGAVSDTLQMHIPVNSNDLEINVQCDDAGVESDYIMAEDFTDVCEDDDEDIMYVVDQSLESNSQPHNQPQRQKFTSLDSTNLLSALSVNPNDYSYFSNDFSSAWAGPDHWKVKPKSKELDTTKLQDKRQPKKKEPKLIDFTSVIDQENWSVPCKCNQLLKRRMQLWNLEKTTLPKDVHYDCISFCKLFFNPDLLIPLKTIKQFDISINTGQMPDDVENVQSFSENASIDTSAVDDCELQTLESISAERTNESRSSSPKNNVQANTEGDLLDGDNLLQQPYKIAKFDRNYARTAKKLNVRRLKSSMWKLLSNHSEGTEGDREGPLAFHVTDRLFSSLYKDLQNCLSEDDLTSLSIPIAFAVLLHLVNEKGLDFTQKTLNDFIISQG